MDPVKLVGLSADALEALSARCLALAADLRKSEPTYELALAAGVVDKSYRTVRFGRVAAYSGEAEVTLADGSRWKCVGHGTRGCPEYISQYGYIEFIPLPKI